MNNVLIDTSVWIDYFGDHPLTLIVDELIDKDRIVINQLILSELLPVLVFKKEMELVNILKSIDQIPLEIRWDNIIQYQVKNLKNGLNKIGIPDLIIVDNCIQNDVELFSRDKHFKLMEKIHRFKVFKI